MNNENLEVLEMKKNPNIAFDSNNLSLSGEEIADDFFDQDLVNLDFDGLDEGSTGDKNIINVPNTDNGINDNVNTEQAIPAIVQEEKKENLELESKNEPDNKQDINSSEKIDEAIENFNPEKISVSNSKKDELDDSYVLSNFDVLFDSLYNDVAGANDLITNLIEKKSSLSKNEQLLADFKEKFEKEKEDFRNFVEVQKKAIESEKSQAASFIESKRARLHTEEAKFNEISEAKKTELSLLEQSLNLEREKFEAEKSNFEEQNKIELEKIKNEREKLNRDIEQFNIDKNLSENLISQGQKELQMQQEQFTKYKELEQKKLDLEEKNLSQSCARFKELVSQFNSGFEQLPSDK